MEDKRVCNNNLFTKIIYSAMFAFLSVVPFALSVIFIQRPFQNYWAQSTLNAFWALAFILFALFFLVAFLAPEQINRKSKLLFIFFIFVLSVSIRVMTCYVLQTTQASDFGRCYDYAAGKEGKYASLGLFPYLGAYSFTLKFFFQFLGTSIFAAQIVNSVFLSFIPVLIFLSIDRLVHNARPAIIGAFVYALYPSLIIYACITSCEHFSQFFLVLSIYSYILYLDNKTKTRKLGKKCFYAGITGICLGITSIYKPILPLLIGVVVMASICYEMIPACLALIHREENAKKIVFAALLQLLIMGVVAMIVFNLLVMMIQNAVLGYTTSEGGHNLGSLLYNGLNPATKGAWNADVIEFISETNQKFSNDKERLSYYIDQLIQAYQNQGVSLIDVLLSKISVDWAVEGVFYYWTNAEIPIVQGTLVGAFLFDNYPALFATITYAICSIGMLCMLGDVWRRGHSQGLFVIVGTFFLFVVLLFFIEAQGRYRSTVMPLQCMLCGLSIWKIGMVLRKCSVFVGNECKKAYLGLSVKRKK